MFSLSRHVHRYLMLFAGLQFLIWALSGVYMVLMDIHAIHGENLVVKQPTPLRHTDIQFDVLELLTQYPQARNVKLGHLLNMPVYRFTQAGNQQMVNAQTGQVIVGVSETLARQIAANSLKNARQIDSVKLITDNPPSEIGSRKLPLWQINIAGVNTTTLYVSPRNGEIVSIRHTGWRVFDALWRLHIMDYTQGEDINNILLNVFTITGLLAVLSGLILLYLRLFYHAEQGGQA